MGFLKSIKNAFKKVFSPILDLFTPDIPDQPEQITGNIVNKQASDNALPVIYGERQVGGTRVFVASENAGENKNKYLYIALAICEGEITSITDIQVDDKPLLELDSSAVLLDNDATTIPNNVTCYQIFKGTPDQAASTLLMETEEWTAEHRLAGVTYIAWRFYWNEDKYRSVPTVKMIVKGRPVRNSFSINDAPQWSDNPAHCLLDYLTNNVYGKGLSDAAIDMASFRYAAAACNETVQEYEGTDVSIPLLTCNAILNSGNTLFDNVKTLLAGMRGMMPFVDGRYSLYIDKELPSDYPYFDLTPENTSVDLQIVSTGKKEIFNKVTAKFTNPETNWQQDFAIWPERGSEEEAAYLAEDGGEVMSTEINLPSVTNFYRARDLAHIVCLNSRVSTFSAAVTGMSECLDIAVGDVVRYEQPSMGWTNEGGNDARQLFRVTNIQIMNTGEVELQLTRYSGQIYIWWDGSEQDTSNPPNLPDPFDVGPPRNLTAVASGLINDDGSLLAVILVDWLPPFDAFVKAYDVQYQTNLQAEGVWLGGVTSGTEYIINGVIKGAIYTVRVRSVSGIGTKSDWVTITLTGVADLIPPSVPTGLTAVGGIGSIQLSWIRPPEKDYEVCEIEEANGPNQAGQRVGAGYDSFTRGGLDWLTTKYFRIRARDYTGNFSGWTGWVFAQTPAFGGDEFDQNIIDLFENAGLYGIEHGDVFPNSYGTGDSGRVFFWTGDNKLYRWTGYEWVSYIDNDDIDGTIEGIKITDNSITVEQMAANSVDTDQLRANSIKTDKISANQITGGLIAASGVITQSAQIDDALIEAAHIKLLEVDELRIKGNAVTVPYTKADNRKGEVVWHRGNPNGFTSPVLPGGTWTPNAGGYYFFDYSAPYQWISAYGLPIDRPQAIQVIATLNLIANASSNSGRKNSHFLRLEYYSLNFINYLLALGYTNAQIQNTPSGGWLTMAQYGVSAIQSDSIALVCTAVLEPTALEDTVYFRMACATAHQAEVNAEGGFKTVGNNNLTVLSVKK